MRDNVKKYLFNFLICFCICIIVLTIYNIFNFKSEIYLSSNDENNIKYNLLKERINNLDDSSCSLLLKDMISTYEKTVYNGEVKLKDIYDVYYEGSSFFPYYSLIQEKCNISKEEMENMDMPFEFTNSVTFIENIVSKYLFQYEISIKDKFSRDIAESSIIGIEYQTCKKSQLSIIEKVLNYMGGEIDE